MPRLIKHFVDTFARRESWPKEGEKLYWDPDLRGFGLRVTMQGARSYVVQYRLGGRKTPTKRFTIGKHGSPWTPATAREKASQLLAAVDLGRDPIAEARDTVAKGLTLRELADRYVAEHVKVKNRPTTAKVVGDIVKGIIKPRLGKKIAAAITRGDVSQLHHEMRKTPRQANMTLAVLSKMFSLAEVWGFRPDGSNPTRKIERYKENRRERYLADAEITTLGEILIAAEGGERPERSEVLDTIRLLLLTGCRMSEVLGLKWTDVDLAAGTLAIRQAKAGARSHPIGAQTIAFLEAMPRRGEFVIPGLRRGAALSKSTLEHAWARIRKRAGLEDVRLHDLRHTVGTFAGQTGANAFLVRDKLGQKTLAMTGRYVHKDADPMRQLSDKIENRIAAALAAKTPAAADRGEVVELPKHRRSRRRS